MRFQTKRSNSNRTNADRIIQNIPPMPRAPRNFMDPRQLPGMNRLTASDGLTIVMAPVRHIPGVDSTPTQILPPVAEEPPPSARHTDPARRYYEQTFVEDLDEPATCGRHVLAALASEPDGMRELAVAADHVPDLVSHVATDPLVQGARDRVVAAMSSPAKGLTVAVQAAKQAYAAGRKRRAWCEETERRLDAQRARIEAFNADWDDLIRTWKTLVYGQEAMDAGYNLAAAYEENRQRVAEANARRIAEGQPPLDATATTFTRGMAAELQQLIVQRATAGSGVAA